MVGIVLNTIDDALDKGKPGPAHWTMDEVTYLRQVLDEARRAGRPVILTADHGHVLDRGQGPNGGPGQPHPANAAQSDSARYRFGVPGTGEITVRGPRVLIPAVRQAGKASRSSPRSTKPSTTPPGRLATTAARPWPRSSSR